MLRGLFAFLLLLLFSACREKSPADMLLLHGQIYTMTKEGERVEAMAIRDGRVLALGSSRDLRKQFVADTLLDLEGMTVLPGFIDAHCHFPAYARSLLTADLRAARSEAHLVQMLQQWYREQVSLGRNLDRIDGWGWDQHNWPGKRMPTRTILDTAFPETPVVLRRVDGHALLVNDAALQAYGVSAVQVKGGEVVLAQGRPTGLLIDNAAELIPAAELDASLMHSALLEAERQCFAAGLTGLNDAGLPLDEWQALRQMLKTGELRMPLYCMAADDSLNFAWLQENGAVEDQRFWLRAVKFYADGALGSRGALLLEPYRDAHQHFGLPVRSSAYLKEHYADMRDLGMQLCTHAIGDSANRMVLKLYGALGAADGDRRWRVEHAQVVAREDWPLFKEFQVLPSVQPTHATSDADWAQDRLGEDRMERAYAYRSLEEQLGRIPLGTDFPIEDIDPLKTLYAAVARKGFHDEPETPFRPNEALSRWKALKGMTVDAAYAQFREDEVGQLKAGMWANWVLWDTDLSACHPDSIPQAKVHMTCVRGEITFSNKASRKLFTAKFPQP